MEKNNKGETGAWKIGQGCSNADSDDDVMEIPRENRHFRPSSSTITRFGNPYFSSSSDDDGDSDDDSLSILYENIKSLNALPELNIETNRETSEIIVDFLKKDLNPYHGCYSSTCNLRHKDLGLCVIFNIGKTPKELNEERSARPTPPTPPPPPPPRPTAALRCGICSNSHVEIFKSGKNLISSVCGHVFCNACLEQCPESHKKCFTCGKKLTRKHYHNLYQ